MFFKSGFFKKFIKEKWYEATECGHKSKKKDVVKAFGEEIITQVPIKNGKTPYCHRCLEKMAIPCAWCGNPIFIGDPITLYSPHLPDGFEVPVWALEFDVPEWVLGFKVHKGAIVYSENPLQLVGCLGWNCAFTGADRMGFWYPPGKVHRVPSPFELSLVNLQKGGDGVISTGDVGDMQEAFQSQKEHFR